MSRTDVLVDADWVEAHLDDPKVVLVEVDEDTSAYDKNHIRNAISIDWKADLQDPVRRDFVNKDAVRGAAVRARASPTTTPSCSTAATTTGSPPTPTGTSSSTATTTSSCSTAAARSGSSTPASWSTEVPSPAGDDVHRQGAGHLDPRLPRRGRRGHRHRRTSSTCARPTSTPAGCSPRRTCRRSSRSGRPHPDRREHPVEQGRQRRRHLQVRRGAQGAVRGKGVDLSKDTIAYCRIGERSAHTWFVLHEMLGQQNVKNYDGSWTEYGSLVGVPVELGDEP